MNLDFIKRILPTCRQFSSCSARPMTEQSMITGARNLFRKSAGGINSALQLDSVREFRQGFHSNSYEQTNVNNTCSSRGIPCLHRIEFELIHEPALVLIDIVFVHLGGRPCVGFGVVAAEGDQQVDPAGDVFVVLAGQADIVVAVFQQIEQPARWWSRRSWVEAGWGRTAS